MTEEGTTCGFSCNPQTSSFSQGTIQCDETGNWVKSDDAQCVACENGGCQANPSAPANLPVEKIFAPSKNSPGDTTVCVPGYNFDPTNDKVNSHDTGFWFSFALLRCRYARHAHRMFALPHKPASNTRSPHSHTHSRFPSIQIIIVAGENTACGSVAASALGSLTLSCDLGAESSCGSNDQNMLACGPFPDELLAANAVTGIKVYRKPVFFDSDNLRAKQKRPLFLACQARR